MSDWRDISTAPRDGTAIWVSSERAMEPVRTIQRWYGEWVNIYNGDSIGWKPTHWMPLPKAPDTPSGSDIS